MPTTGIPEEPAYFKVSFDEGKIYPVDNGYILAAYVNGYSGVIRSFKPEQPLEQGLCAIPFYSEEYEIRQKVNGEWTGVKHNPSIFEKFFCTYIEANESIFMPEGQGINGEITHIPDGMCGILDAEGLTNLIRSSLKITSIPLQGLLKPYTPPSGNGQRRSNSGGFRGISPEDKLAFVKKQLLFEIGDNSIATDSSLGVLIANMQAKYPLDDNFLAIYFDTLQAIIS